MEAQYIRMGEQLFANSEKMSSDLLCLTYGVLVTTLLKDYHQDPVLVNAELDKMGYNLGCRLIDELLSRAPQLQCHHFRDTCMVISKLAFKLYLGLTADVTQVSKDGRTCVISFKSSPLLEFVELPTSLSMLQYQALLTGCIRGSLAMLSMQVELEWLKDELKGSNESEIKITLKEVVNEEFIADED